MAPSWPKMAPSWPQRRPRWPQDGQEGSKMAPRWPKMAPRWPQDAPKMAQVGPRWPQVDPRWAPNGFKRGPTSLPNRSSEAFQHRSRKRECPGQSQMRPGGRPTCILRCFFNILCCNLRGVRPIPWRFTRAPGAPRGGDIGEGID